jgi:hypothetical protein
MSNLEFMRGKPDQAVRKAPKYGNPKLEVEATQKGSYLGRRKVGDRFHLREEGDFSTRWMKAINWKPGEKPADPTP